MCPPVPQLYTRPRTAGLQVEQEEKERRKKEKAEAHLYTLVRISTDADLRGQIGSSRFFDLVDHDKVGG
jgi:ubiquitin carboxyl-terminal hydrolase 7